MSLQNIATHLAQHGRGDDTMLIHMTPKEVGGLQQLAQAHGGSLTINPHTGLPEAGFLDNLMPTIIGAGLTYFSGGTINPMMAAGIVGGVQAARTGDIGKGLLAGLGAYGGAGLTGGLANLGVQEEIAGKAASGAFGAVPGSELINPETIGDASMVQAGSANPAEYATKVREAVANASANPNYGLGLKTAMANPSAYVNELGGGMGLAQKGLMAAAPMLAAPQTTTQMPGKTSPTAYVQTKMVNPYTKEVYDVSKVPANEFKGTYQDQINNADLSRYITAADGGLMGMTQPPAPGMFNYAQMEPAVDLHSSIGVNPSNTNQPQKMAEGGIAHFDAGGYTATDVANYLQANPGMSDAQIAAAMDQYHVNPALVAQATGLNVGDVQSRYNAVEAPPAGGGSYTLPAGTTQQYATTVATGPSVNPYISNTDIQNWFKANQGASDATIANAMNQYGVSAGQVAAATGVNPTDVMDRYGLASNLQQATGKGGSLFGEAVGRTPNALDPQTVAWMDNHVDPVTGKPDPMSVQEVARITGMPVSDVQYRYDLVKHPVQTIKPVAPTTTVTNPTTFTPNPATIATNAIQNAPATTLVRGVSGNTGAGIEGGGTVVNPNGTITESPVIPGIPKGGFTGMGNVLDTFTSRGGNTGYTSPTVSTMDEFNARYNQLSGGSKQAFDYLQGKADYTPVPYTKDKRIMKPYSEATLGVPQSIPNTQKYYVDSSTGKLTLNKNYDAAAASGITTSGKPGTSGSSISVPNVGTATFDPVSGYYYINGRYYDASGKEQSFTPPELGANGGLMGMAHGGSTDEYNLGSYSDGGRLLRGPGDGVSDSIPATIGKGQPARLADGEFVVPARIVSELGNGSTEAGAKQLYAMMDRIQKARGKTVGKGKIATNTKAAKYLPA